MGRVPVFLYPTVATLFPAQGSDIAEAAVMLAAAIDNLVAAQHILAAVSTRTSRPLSDAAEQAWETEGGYSGAIAPHRRTDNG